MTFVTFLVEAVTLSSLFTKFVNGLSKAPSSNLFLASEILPIALVKKSAKGVSKSLASSKSPTIICHVLDQPD